MSSPLPKRKGIRRASANYYITAEDHVDNEVKHEKLLTDTSKLSSSWASLRVTGPERQCSEEIYSSASSANSSPAVHRPSSFSGPLAISVTCSSSSASQVVNVSNPLSPNQHAVTSCHPSPCASPVSSRVQCYSPGIGVKTLGGKRSSGYPNGSASPLLVSAAQKRKRVMPTWNSVCGSSAEHSRESSPDRPSSFSKIQKPNHFDNADISSFRWPPNSPCSSNHGLAMNAPSSPSTMSLPSPRLSVSSTSNHNPYSPASYLLTSSNSGNQAGHISEPENSGQSAKVKSNSANSSDSVSNLTVKPSLDEESNLDTVAVPSEEPFVA
ncbi:hypothetical protein Ciccas_003156 [Cichlidogyrus casuarinus]|uniref:Uncharacterized protein n=1 Tax=Cichlidogyrus casuarinus TaxID=1844966 RepID=A0ABD2QFC7_9PLAT